MLKVSITARRERDRREPLHRPYKRQHQLRNSEHLHGRWPTRRQQLTDKRDDIPSAGPGKQYLELDGTVRLRPGAGARAHGQRPECHTRANHQHSAIASLGPSC